MHVPLLGEITALRAFFLFLFFYSNDSNSLGTWSTFGAGMLLSNLGTCTRLHAFHTCRALLSSEKGSAEADQQQHRR